MCFGLLILPLQKRIRILLVELRDLELFKIWMFVESFYWALVESSCSLTCIWKSSFSTIIFSSEISILKIQADNAHDLAYKNMTCLLRVLNFKDLKHNFESRRLKRWPSTRLIVSAMYVIMLHLNLIVVISIMSS